MDNKRNSSERGQVLILVVFAIIALLAFTAVAVDGTMLYSDRRATQNAADASALAGGAEAALEMEDAGVTADNFKCNSAALVAAMAEAKSQAIAQAKDNGFVIDGDLSDKNGAVIEECKDSGDKYFSVRVMLTSETPTSFLQFVYKGAVKQTIETVVRVSPRAMKSHGAAIIALNTADCSGNKNGVQFRGNLKFQVTGGGVWSNGCMDKDGQNKPYIKQGEATYFDGTMANGSITFLDANGVKIPGKNATKLTDTSWQIPYELYDFALPQQCLDPDNIVAGSSIRGNKILTGVYCIKGDVDLTSCPDTCIEGHDVTLVFLGGHLKQVAGTHITLINGAAESGLPNVVIYMPREFYGECGKPNQEIKFTASGASKFVGGIIAPCTDISIEGNNKTDNYNSTIVGWNVNSGGTSAVYVTYNGIDVGTDPTSIDLWR